MHVCDLTDLVDTKGISSTSDTEQIPGGASLPRDQVSQPQPPTGSPATGELSFGELRKEVVSDPGPRTPGAALEGVTSSERACTVVETEAL